MKKYLENRDLIILIEIIVIFILLAIISIILLTKEDKKEEGEIISISTVEKVTTTLNSDNEYYVDIKGSVKKPGVYKVKEGTIVNDVIKLAGGLKSGAYTANINLSQSTKDEMVIYIYSKDELKKLTTPIITNTTCTTNVIEVNNCVTSTTTTSKVDSTESTLVNINTATKEQLMTLSGIGESKAIAILDYRKNTKFNSIEDIKNVSGIGDSMYAKIKDYITV